ncbi:MAG: hypothetical protein WCV90_06640 [Candidatus Woesearchaeota archaeon]|jgi:hypothetical protein
MHSTFFYSRTIPPHRKREFVNLLTDYLTPTDEEAFSLRATYPLSYARKQIGAFLEGNLDYAALDSLRPYLLQIAMDYSGTAEMAKAIGLYPGVDIESYKPEATDRPGQTGLFKIAMSPVPSPEGRRVVAEDLKNGFGLRLHCTPDYRCHIDMSPQEEQITAIQSLRFGWDFFARPLEALIGKPELVLLHKAAIPLELAEELIRPELPMEERVRLIERIDIYNR